MKLSIVSISLLILLYSASCADNTEHYNIKRIEYHPTYSEFYLADGRIFVATKIDNEPYYKNIKKEITQTKSVYFYKGRMFIAGTGEEGEFISKGDISLKVKQKK